MEQHVLIADAMVGKYRVKLFRSAAGMISGHATGPKGSQPFTVQSDGLPHWVYGMALARLPIWWPVSASSSPRASRVGSIRIHLNPIETALVMAARREALSPSSLVKLVEMRYPNASEDDTRQAYWELVGAGILHHDSEHNVVVVTTARTKVERSHRP